MRRCLGCMKTYDEAYEICPHCGYIYGTGAQSPNHLPPGTILQNRYELGRVLGQGGFGITYIAWDMRLEKAVAIKEFFPTSVAARATGQTEITCFDPESQQMFRSGLQKMVEESRMLARFTELKSVVQVQDCVEENGTAYIIMELLRGETVQSILKREGKLSLRRTMQIITPILRALDEINRAGLVHRDVSPDNIFVCSESGYGGEPEVKLLDFGAARVANGLDNKTLSIVLKKGFAPTEQYSSRGRQGSYTDVYAVSATIYKMLTGITPPSSLDRMGEDTLEPMSRYAEVPQPVEKVLRKGMELEAKDRIQTAGELLRQLQKAIEKAEKTEPGGKGGRGGSRGKTTDKKTLRTALIAAGSLLLIAAIVIIAVAAVRSGNGLRSSLQVGDTVRFGSYDARGSGAEPITWTVLERDGNKALLLSDEALDYRAYHDENDSGSSFTWETSGMREWLNTDFYDAAFTEKEQARIILHRNETPDNPIYGSDGGTDTIDRVFLLSMQEAETYMPRHGYRIAVFTQAMQNMLGEGEMAESGFCRWATRSSGAEDPAEKNMTFMAVSTDGELYSEVDGIQDTAVRPAIWVNVRKASGDADKPWTSGYRANLYDFSWEEKDGVLNIRGSGVMRELSYTEFDGVRDRVKSVVIEDGFTTISDSLLMDFSALQSVQIPSSVKEIGTFAFRNCPKLKTIELPSGLQRMGYSVFTQSGVASNKAYWKNDLFCVGHCLVRVSRGLKGTVRIPPSITVIADHAFEDCSLSGVELPQGIRRLDGAFLSCANLQSVRVPDSVQSIRGTFNYCSSLTDVQLPDGLEYIIDGFYACESLESVRLPKSLRYIGDQAFSCCWALREIIMYDKVSTIESNAFFNCSSLETVYYTGTEEQMNEIDIGDGNDDLLQTEFTYDFDDTAVTTTAAAVTTTVPQTSSFASLQVGDTFKFGSYDQDGVDGAEPIEWIVLDLDGDTAMATSRYGLECRAYHNSIEHVTWEKSDLRKWLNGTFYNSAFTAQEKEQICEALLDNDDNLRYKVSGGAQTEDRVFLLSVSEVTALMPSESARVLPPTKHASDNGTKPGEKNKNGCWWCLRSPGAGPDMCMIVTSNGHIPDRGEMVNADSGAVRPAIWISTR